MTPREGRIAFEKYVLDLETRELAVRGRGVSLQDKPFCLLLKFLEHPGRVIARADLYDVLWPADLHVDREAGLNTAVRKLRAALKEASGSDDCELLETVPRAGYRLMVGELRALPIDEPAHRVPSRGGTGRPGRPRLGSALGVAFAAMLAVVGLFWAWGWHDREPDVVSEPMPHSLELRADYLEARSLITMGGDLRRARVLLRSLAEESPEFSPAHAYLAEVNARLAVRSAATVDLKEARRTAHRALELDPGSAVAHRVLAMLALTFDWDAGTAANRLALALEYDPGDPVTHMARAAYESALGRHEDAIAAVRRAVDLEPDSMLFRGDAGHFLLRAGRFREAARECEMVVRLDSDNTYARDCLLTAYSSSGDFESARPHAVHLLERSGASAAEIERASTVRDPRRVYLSRSLEQLLERPERSTVRIATHYLALGNEDGALTWLEVAARERDPMLIFALQSAGFSEIRRDRRYRELVRAAGLEKLAEHPDRSNGPSQNS